MAELYGAVEAGGTKMVLGLGTGPDDLREVERLPTEQPTITVPALADYFARMRAKGYRLRAVGIASFGPAGIVRDRADWGHLLQTPKPGWSGVDLASPVAKAADAPVAFDTDVNGAALGEGLYGAGREVRSLVYVTVGTGIGGGALVDGKPLHGLVHPEMGHLAVRRDPLKDPYPGRCPFHGDCLEGLASGPALIERWRSDPATLPADHPCWTLQADYLAQACAAMTFLLSPERIVLGGGVMAQAQLYPLIRARLAALLAGYPGHPRLQCGMEDYLVPPGLGAQAGLVGALALAQQQFP